MPTTKVIIAGIGGVGGYFGGLLAKHFYSSPSVEICFFARGANLQQIKKNGLRVVQGKTDFIAYPALATDKPEEMGVADFIILCTKAYDLEDTVKQLAPCIAINTIILPLLNGVDSRERIKNIVPNNLVLDGCVYIVSRLIAPGVVENFGNLQKLYFGLDNVENENLNLFYNLLFQAGIEAVYSEQILSTIWEKFIFISPTATATAYYNNTISEIVSQEQKLITVKELLEEIKQIALAKQVSFPVDISEKIVTRLKSLPPEITSSMHSDFLKCKHHTELESLTGYVINEAANYKLAVPTYLKMYEKLSKVENYQLML